MIYRSIVYFALLAATASGAIIDPSLRPSLRSESTANIMVAMKGGVDAAIARTERRSYSTRTQRVQSLSDSLEANAERSQKSLLQLLNREDVGASYESFWISNSVYVKDASPELIKKIADLPEVYEIHKEQVIQLDPLIEEVQSDVKEELEWGIKAVAADKVWQTGNKGEGIVVGSIDTGVRYSHVTLKDSYVGAAKHGWYDPYEKTAEPNDDHGHGTHTMGTIVGSQGIGVAPGATWLSCKGCSRRGCTEAALVGCGQYTLCPTDSNGKNKDCSLAPHISSNSWGGGNGSPFYQKVVKAWRAAGIIPVFANGNSGPRCGTANSPGDYSNVIGVGASTISSGLASFSSVGPSVNGIVKPDVSAPGLNVNSAWHTDDADFKAISGTSMACPHTAGVIALAMSSNAKLNYDTIYKALAGSSTIGGLSRPNKNCGDISEYDYPNNAFGYGIVHAENMLAFLDGTMPPRDTDDPSDGGDPIQCKWDDEISDCVPQDKCRKGPWWNPKDCARV